MSNFKLLVRVRHYFDWVSFDEQQIHTERNKKLDTYEGETIDITYNITDISDFSNSKSTYSKNIKLPGTPNNRDIFAHTCELSSDLNVYRGWHFDVNRKTQCWVVVDGVVVLQGHLQLNSIELDNDNNVSSFDCLVFGETANFFGLLENKELYDLSFTDLNHLWNANSMTATWTTGQGKGYYYPFIDYGQGYTYNELYNPNLNIYGVKPKDMFPAIYIKSLWDRVFQYTKKFEQELGLENATGYTYQSEFLNSEFFKSLIMPFNGEKMQAMAGYYDIYGNYIMGINDKTSFRVGLQNSIGVGGLPNTGLAVFGTGGFQLVGHYQAGVESFKGIGRFDDMGWNTGNSQSYFDAGHEVLDPNTNLPLWGDYWINNSYYYKNTFTQSGTSAMKQRFCFDFKVGTFHPCTPETCFRTGFATASVDSGGFNTPNDGIAENEVAADMFGCKIVIQICRERNPYTGQQDPSWNNGGGYPIAAENGDLWWTVFDSIDNNPVSEDINLVNTPFFLDGWTQWSDSFSGLIKTAYLDNSHPTLRPIMYNERVRVVFQFKAKWGGGPAAHETFHPSASGIANIPNGYVGQNSLISIGQNLICMGTNAYLPSQITGFGIPAPDYTSVFYNEVTLDLVAGSNTQGLEQNGSYINYTEILPKGIKIKDFMKDIIQKFNLFIEPDKKNPKLLNIEPRDDYYAKGETKNWTDKVDIKDIKADILVQQQSKINKWLWKEDKDYYNTHYKNNFQKGFGDFTYTIDNDYINGEKAITSIFSSTPLVVPKGANYALNRVADELVCPTFVKELNNVKSVPNGVVATNIRILMRRPAGYQVLTNNFFTFDGTVYNKYPYAGNVDHPVDPSFDLDYYQPLYLFYENDNYTARNLCSVFWRSTILEVSDRNSRLVHIPIRLTSYDISNFKFNDKILLNLTSDIQGGGPQLYRVNRITGYDPANPTKFAKVELIKIIKHPIPSFPNRSKKYGPIDDPGDVVTLPDTLPPISNMMKMGKLTIETPIVFTNEVAEVELTRIFENVNYITGGVDSVLDLYNDVNINYITGGFGTVVEIGNDTPVNYITGGFFSVDP